MNQAFRFRIYPTKEQELLLAKTFGCCRFLYNQMLNAKIEEYKKTGKMLRNTPAMYKKEYPFLKEVDSLALANVQLHLERAYRNFFGNPAAGFPKFKSKHRNKNSYTTNMVNGNIQVDGQRLKLPENIMPACYARLLTVKTKQREKRTGMQGFWGLIMRCMEWQCFRRKQGR